MIWCPWLQLRLCPQGALERRHAPEEPPADQRRRAAGKHRAGVLVGIWEKVKLRFCDKYQSPGHFQAFVAPQGAPSPFDASFYRLFVPKWFRIRGKPVFFKHVLQLTDKFVWTDE